MLQNEHIDFFNNRPFAFALSLYGLPFFIASKFTPIAFHLLDRFPFEHVPKMARTVQLDPKIVNLKSEAVEYFEGMVLEPVKDGFPFAGNNNVMTKFVNHLAILNKIPAGRLRYSVPSRCRPGCAGISREDAIGRSLETPESDVASPSRQ